MNSNYVGEAGGGLVKVVVNAKGYVSSVDIDDSIFKSDDKQFISDLFAAAVNNAFTKVEEALKDVLASSKYYQDFNK